LAGDFGHCGHWKIANGAILGRVGCPVLESHELALSTYSDAHLQ